MRFGRYGIGFLALSGAFAFRARELSAQAQIISLAATAPSTLAVTVTSGAAQTLAGVTDNAVNSFPAAVVIQTDWNVNPGQTNTVNLVAYFTTPAQALVGGATQIPSSRLLGRMLTGIPTTFTAISQNGIGGAGTAGGSLSLFAVNINGANKNATRTDNLDLQLNLIGFPTLGAGSYTGVLNLRAVTQ
jgi:VCBS repeat-containing protein